MNLGRKIGISFIAIVLILSFAFSSAFAAEDMLKRGSKGSSVEELQTILKQQNFFDYDKITGYFGKITEDAVKAFQRANGLKADGIVGELTWDVLRNQTDSNGSIQSTEAQANPQSESSNGTISEGMDGSDVEKIQKRLQELGLYEYSRITGYYGSITEEAVMAFQRAYGLKQDGVVGPATMEKLFSTYKETSLIPGMKSDDVEDLQSRLKELGYYSYSVDGEYGIKTKEAVVYFQSAHGLSADGVAGTQTKQMLYSSGAITEQEARRSLNKKYEEDDKEETPPSEVTPSDGDKVAQAISLAKSKIGSPYVYGEEGPDSFDCSGFTTFVMESFGVSLPRTAYNQGYDQYGIKITDRNNLQPGDLVFFNTNNSDGDLSDHVGIYLGNGDFIHANSGSARSVCISNMETSSFYASAFSWGRRVLD